MGLCRLIAYQSDDGVFDWSSKNIEATLSQKQTTQQPKHDSTKRIGNHSFDEQIQMEMAVQKSPVTGRFFSQN
jgi:hypothetical protein